MSFRATAEWPTNPPLAVKLALSDCKLLWSCVVVAGCSSAVRGLLGGWIRADGLGMDWDGIVSCGLDLRESWLLTVAVVVWVALGLVGV